MSDNKLVLGVAVIAGVAVVSLGVLLGVSNISGNKAYIEAKETRDKYDYLVEVAKQEKNKLVSALQATQEREKMAIESANQYETKMQQMDKDHANKLAELENDFVKKNDQLAIKEEQVNTLKAQIAQMKLDAMRALQNAQEDRMQAEKIKNDAAKEQKNILAAANNAKKEANRLNQQAQVILDGVVAKNKADNDFKETNLALLKNSTERMNKFLENYKKAEGFSIDIVAKRIVDNLQDLINNIKVCQGFDPKLVDEQVKLALQQANETLVKAKKIARVK